MSREIETHKVNGLNESLRVRAVDKPGAGGACHQYCIHVERDALDVLVWDLHFQEGPLQEAGVNGISNEALLAIVLDRLEGFQSGNYACDENANALEMVTQAMQWLRLRTENRAQRGVEGTSVV